MTGQQTLQLFDEETRLAHRLHQHGIRPFAGDTTTSSRKEAIRAALLATGKGWIIVGPRPGTTKPETYAEFFERIYGEPLDPTPPKPPRKGKSHAHA